MAAEGEDIERVELPFDDALRMVKDGRIVDGKTVEEGDFVSFDGLQLGFQEGKLDAISAAAADGRSGYGKAG